jgi:hypothetical protein
MSLCLKSRKNIFRKRKWKSFKRKKKRKNRSKIKLIKKINGLSLSIIRICLKTTKETMLKMTFGDRE